MKKILILLGFIGCNIAMAQNKNHVQSVLWKVVYAKTGATSYVLGTNHSLGNAWLNKFHFLVDIIASSDVMFTETASYKVAQQDMDGLNDGKPKTFIELFGRDSLLVDSFYNAYLGFPIGNIGASKNIVPNNSFEKQKLFLVAFNDLAITKFHVDLSNQYKLRADTFDITNIETLDGILEKTALKNKKPLFGLDDNVKVIKSFANVSLISTEIVSTIKDIVNYQNGVRSEHNDKRIKDLKLFYKGLMDFTVAYTTKLKDADKASLLDRNKLWGDRLKEELKNKNAFIAVGAGHLFFRKKYGILDVLKRSGYIVTPVNMIEASKALN
ncbi:hypothetical protein EZJ43_08255 [Pedobacter changchengzhani]|uniref:TraB/GumN family protein n=1 Tax=Pedobacter changchengzhani TaxID=2529274 RepID=A0A4R5MLC4_9SPHI|nr:TraB/GumN family protein [Pedobacter changchengzhani]TDG36500.1 hypothetical protein EZJ43_08255 [Pedobacter changchengzhani]